MKAQLNILPLKNWLKFYEPPLIISGPCSAESEEQLLNTAKEISRLTNVKIFRVGIWKPRTRPDYFEGVGNIGLEWLKVVKDETGMKTAVEVANSRHVEDCLEHGVDILWIGARTVVNPFSIQEISEVLKGVDIPVMVKNPVNPDLELWIGALERINFVGIKKLIAVHRGFYFFEKSPFRNAPMWEVPIELKRIFPELPVIVDPSHICGNKELLLQISQKALDLEMDGLMIETHINPEIALTDAKQQITPAELKDLISKLVIRNKSGNIEFENKLEELRAKIDEVDYELIDIIAKRLDLVKQIGEYKRNSNITILQLERWRNVIQDRLKKGVEKGLNKKFLIDLFELVHEESIRLQNEIMNK